jgi:hypothetical protein
MTPSLKFCCSPDSQFIQVKFPVYSTYPTINMEKAKAAVSSFLSKDGKHDTTVHEVSPGLSSFPPQV